MIQEQRRVAYAFGDRTPQLNKLISRHLGATATLKDLSHGCPSCKSVVQLMLATIVILFNTG